MVRVNNRPIATDPIQVGPRIEAVRAIYNLIAAKAKDIQGDLMTAVYAAARRKTDKDPGPKHTMRQLLGLDRILVQDTNDDDDTSTAEAA